MVAYVMPDGPPSGMIQTQRIPVLLTPLDDAFAILAKALKPVTPTNVALARARGRIAATNPALNRAIPEFNTAISDGWALRANDIVGASSYSPVLLNEAPRWIEAGERVPDDCDCIVDADLIEQVGPSFQVIGEVIPGKGVRRKGDDAVAGSSIVGVGNRITARHVALARAAGVDALHVRCPRVRVVDVASRDGDTSTSTMLSNLLEKSGAEVTLDKCAARDVNAISSALKNSDCDLIVTIGGTGEGRSDETVKALSSAGQTFAHGIAVQPGRTAAIGAVNNVPVVCAPGAVDQAFGVWLALIEPALDMLAVRAPRIPMSGKLTHKISSSTGVSEIALLKCENEFLTPVGVGTLALSSIATADAWTMIPANSEGFAAGASIEAVFLDDKS